MTDAIIGLVVDRSGSMTTMWDEAVAGINRFKNEQAEVDGKAWIIFNYFDTEFGQRYFAWDANDIPDLGTDDKEISPRGLTALIDATAKTILDCDRWLDDNDWFDGKVYVVVVTDGLENASQEFKNTDLKSMIQEREEKGWTFVYLAANVDLEATRRDLGFGVASSMSYDKDSVGVAYATTSAAITRSRMANADDYEDLFEESERDVKQ